jgi:hypothetical protein
LIFLALTKPVFRLLVRSLNLQICSIAAVITVRPRRVTARQVMLIPVPIPIVMRDISLVGMLVPHAQIFVIIYTHFAIDFVFATLGADGDALLIPKLALTPPIFTEICSAPLLFDARAGFLYAMREYKSVSCQGDGLIVSEKKAFGAQN